MVCCWTSRGSASGVAGTGQGVFPDDLEEAQRRQGVRVRPGDAVLLRTGTAASGTRPV